MNHLSKCLILGAALITTAASAQDTARAITRQSVMAAEPIIRMEFTDSERVLMLGELEKHAAAYDRLRTLPLPNNIPPAISFNPIPVGFIFAKQRTPFELSKRKALSRPPNLDDVAFWSIGDLAELVRTRRVTSVELTTLYLSRLKQYGPKLECVITLTEDRALEEARRADLEIGNGHYRGPLHGIPYGVKDLLATKDYPTTWGAMPFKNQTIDTDATVIKKLQEAGAVLVAKLTLGALAWG